MATPQVNIDHLAEVPPMDNRLVDRESTRYLVFTGDLPTPYTETHPAGGIDLGSPCVRAYAGAPGYFNRCLITPCIKVSMRRIAEEIPDGMLITQRIRDRDAWGRPTDYVDVPLYPGDEAENLLRTYNHWGLVELQALRGMSQSSVSAMRLNSFFWPSWPELPETADGLLEQLNGRLEAARHDNNRTILLSVAQDLLKAAEANKAWMFTFIEASHAQMSAPPSDMNYKGKYDTVDLHFLKRLGMQRRDHDLQTMVDTQELIGKVLSSQGLQNNQGLSAEQFTTAMQAILAANADHLQKVLNATLEAAKAPAVPTPEPDEMKEGPYPPTTEIVLNEFGEQKPKKK